MVEVIFYESITCPRCARLRPILERICDALHIPFIRKIVDFDPHIWGFDEARETFTPEFIREHAPDLAQNQFVMALAARLSRASHTPTTVISANLEKPIRIVIRGFPTQYSKETALFERNLFITLHGLKEAEKQIWSRGGR